MQIAVQAAWRETENDRKLCRLTEHYAKLCRPSDLNDGKLCKVERSLVDGDSAY